jgi:hypothetical protein
MHIVIVVPRADVAQANDKLMTDGDDKTGRTFTTALSPTGQLPWTHSWCGWRVTPGLATKLSAWSDTLAARGWRWFRLADADGGVTREQILTTCGLQVLGSQ